MKLRIEKAVYGGAGLGRVPQDAAFGELAGKTVFVPLTLPGELVDCEIIEDRRSFANARLVQVIEAAAERVAPPCQYFPVCGGCHYQQASYAAQLAMKRTILAETLAHAGVPLAADSIATLAGEPLQYRNRIRLHIRFGDFALCYREAGSHRDVAVDYCPIATPLLQQAFRVFPETALGTGLASGLFDEVELFTNAEEDALLLSLWTTQGAAATRALAILCEALVEALPQLRGALLFQVETQKGQGRQQAAWGEPQLTYRVHEHGYRVSAGSFFQVNRFVLPALLPHVLSDHKGGGLWDLYAGVGLFATALAERFEQVTAVELAASSVRDLRENLHGGRARVVAASTLDFLKSRARDSKVQRPDLIVVDPPRAGLGKDVTSLLSQIGAPKLTYISCDPATLARDLQWLLHSGYHLKTITLADLFPQTFHLETVAELVRD
jgi:23S rRNA (uracil1939-C5)-methyltransferase